MIPSGMPAPAPSKIASSVMNMTSSEKACDAIEVSAVESCSNSSVVYMTDISFFRSNSMVRNFGLDGVTDVPSPTQLDETPPHRLPVARLVSSTPGILIPFALALIGSLLTRLRISPMSCASMKIAAAKSICTRKPPPVGSTSPAPVGALTRRGSVSLPLEA